MTKSQLREIIREEISKLIKYENTTLNEDAILNMGYKKEKIATARNGDHFYTYTLSGTHFKVRLAIWERISINDGIYLQGIVYEGIKDPDASGIVYKELSEKKMKKFKNKSSLESYIKRLHPQLVKLSNGSIDQKWKL